MLLEANPRKISALALYGILRFLSMNNLKRGGSVMRSEFTKAASGSTVLCSFAALS